MATSLGTRTVPAPGTVGIQSRMFIGRQYTKTEGNYRRERWSEQAISCTSSTALSQRDQAARPQPRSDRDCDHPPLLATRDCFRHSEWLPGFSIRKYVVAAMANAMTASTGFRAALVWPNILGSRSGCRVAHSLTRRVHLLREETRWTRFPAPTNLTNSMGMDLPCHPAPLARSAGLMASEALQCSPSSLHIST